ncbi:DUF2147 domain-containing protein [Flavobacterium sp. xlx-214]|uniref:DUF2147 domain-containing protein n=1 Tax=unclassified Flavobacterium TaxID=196869 RepID=UPI0013D7592E|nr:MULTISPECIES: DUF2147 domain-containing protein [unclassified Flavobacterium]MBA5791349.1 DUF2147 domain-containing protein [Flavobacterium sp. xlx-221]QMI83496.1 DUF2147 domain-containing protein [Flavobacterium sp. xlx-214]
MKNVIVTFLLTAFAVVGLQAQVTGKWKTIDDETGKAKSIVEISEKDGKYYGKVIEILTDKKEAKCDKCPGADKGKPIKGLTIIKGLKKDGSEYSGGTITDPSSGKEYKCAIKLNGKDKLDVRGYVGIQALGRTQTWVRTN